MRLSSFITGNLDAILADWVCFAASQLPAAADMDEAAIFSSRGARFHSDDPQ